MYRYVVCLLIFCSAVVQIPAVSADEVLVPVVDGPWWQIAGDPDLGRYTTERQQPVDFAIWQAADGTWQLWSCIRHTACGRYTRLFHRWEGQSLTDRDWKPIGIAMEGRPDLGEGEGGLQAPHVVRHEGLYYMAYGDWFHICFATSQDGKHFERVIQPDGKTGVFGEAMADNTRDAMLICIDGLWHCYYTASPDGKGYAYCRTSADLRTWSHSCVVSYGGIAGTGPWNNECPHVVEVEPGLFYFFRNQYYGERARNWVYASRNPLNFGIDDDRKLIRSWRVAAPEIICHEGQYYVASLLDSLKGIQLARLKWVRVPDRGAPLFDFTQPEERGAWKLQSGDLATVFTDSQRSGFRPPAGYFIGTAETGNAKFDDDRQGVIESPVVTLRDNHYLLYLSGGQDLRRLYVALLDADTGQELVRCSGDGTNELKPRAIHGADWVGKRAFLRIVDEAAGPWGHVNFGGMYTDPLAPYRD